MAERIILSRDNERITVTTGNFPTDIERQQEFLVASIIMLIQILKKECLAKQVDKESFIFKVLETIKNELQSKKNLIIYFK